MTKIIPFLILLAPPAALPQDGVRVTGPVAGFVLDSAQHALRPILGVPGSSYLGAAVIQAVDRAAVSPDGRSVLMISGGRLLLVSGLRGAAPAALPIETIEGIDRIAWSPNGALAAIYSSAARQAVILRDLANTPAGGAPIRFEDAVTALAISSGGDLVVGSESGVFLLAADAAPRLLTPATRPIAVGFCGQDLFIAEAAGRILMV